MERFLAAATLVALGFVQWAANVPLELWVIKGHIASGVIALYALVCLVALVAPGDNVETNGLVGAIGVSFWSLRSADLAHAHMSGQGNYLAASAISALLALAVGLYYARAVRSLAFWARFNADDE